LVLSQEETFFLQNSKTGIGALPIQPLSAAASNGSSSSSNNTLPPLPLGGPTSETVKQAHAQLKPILAALPDEEKAQAYRSWLGYYNSYTKQLGWKKADLVREAGLLAVSGLGWTQSKPPSIEPKAVGMMGLKGVPGLNIVRREVVPTRAGARRAAVQVGMR